MSAEATQLLSLKINYLKNGNFEKNSIILGDKKVPG